MVGSNARGVGPGSKAWHCHRSLRMAAVLALAPGRHAWPRVVRRAQAGRVLKSGCVVRSLCVGILPGMMKLVKLRRTVGRAPRGTGGHVGSSGAWPRGGGIRGTWRWRVSGALRSASRLHGIPSSFDISYGRHFVSVPCHVSNGHNSHTIRRLPRQRHATSHAPCKSSLAHTHPLARAMPPPRYERRNVTRGIAVVPYKRLSADVVSFSEEAGAYTRSHTRST